jgi:hypothetical protein
MAFVLASQRCFLGSSTKPIKTYFSARPRSKFSSCNRVKLKRLVFSRSTRLPNVYINSFNSTDEVTFFSPNIDSLVDYQTDLGTVWTYSTAAALTTLTLSPIAIREPDTE